MSITIRSCIVFAVLATTIVANIDAVDKDFRFQLLDPRGYRVSFKPLIEIATVTLHGVINEKREGTLIGRFAAKIEMQMNGWFVYQNTSTPVDPGHIVYFWAHIDLPSNKSYSTAIRTYVVPQDPRVPAN